ncbi:MAG: type I polyketide synthase, partial [Chloroflexota bacterium]
RSPAAGEVQVEVKAVGLNFRDVLNSLGMLKEYYADVLGIGRAQDVGLGFECAGIVTQVGEDVTDLAVGDRVMGLGTLDGTFASYITLPASQMAPIPEHLTYADAATIPMTFLTAWYGLVELANLQPGERILIHAASGGVGQAAVQIAQAIGAKVFGTASPGKWDLLREQGITQLMNSRTLAFADEILELTQGKGVDVVLNSLNGDFIDRSFIALGQQGRFVEIGKIGIWSHEQVEQARPDATYYPFDLGEAMEQDSTLLTRLWQALTPQLQTGALQPLPQTIFPAHEAVDAFRTMQQTKQIGKIVISFEQPKPYTLHEKATYLITGGLGALGLQTAYQMVEDGAKHLLLTGRRGVTTNEQQIILDQLTEAGAQIQVIQADIAQEEDVRSLIEMCQKIVPLRGIIHTAGVLDDGILTAQTAQRFEQVMRPKVDGTWHLHSLTQAAQIELDFFICFSSAASMLGGAGQSNYAAANAFMDTLMQHRHQLGLPGLSINWGPWAEVGMAAHLEKQMKQQGISTIPPKQGRQLFQYLSQQNVAQIGVVPFRHQASDSRQVPAAETERSGIRELLSDLTPSDRESRLGEYLRTEIAAVMGLTNTNIDSRTRLFDFGMDSLMAVELRNRIEADLGCQLRATLLFDYPALNVLIPYILHDILDLGSTESHEHVDERDTDSSDEDEQALLDELSEDEISDMLLSKLDRLGF